MLRNRAALGSFCVFVGVPALAEVFRFKVWLDKERVDQRGHDYQQPEPYCGQRIPPPAVGGGALEVSNQQGTNDDRTDTATAISRMSPTNAAVSSGPACELMALNPSSC